MAIEFKNLTRDSYGRFTPVKHTFEPVRVVGEVYLKKNSNGDTDVRIHCSKAYAFTQGIATISKDGELVLWRSISTQANLKLDEDGKIVISKQTN